MVKVRCDNFGNCPLGLDDGEIHRIDDAAAHKCPLRDEGLACGFQEVPKGSGPGLPEWWPRAALAGGAVLVVGLLVWLVVRLTGLGTPGCKVEDVQTLLRGDSKLVELERKGRDCLQAGTSKGNVDQLVAGTTALRVAADKGSADAAYQLGRLFDPEARKALEEDAANPALLPAVDVVTALGFYDRAAKAGDSRAATAADKLRARDPALKSTARAQPGRALTLPGHGQLYQRILAKPGAMLVPSPGGADGTPLPTFAILYVFEKQPGWLKVGATLDRGGEGWISEDKAQPWSVMLAMRYLPQGERGPVLFFRDEMAVKGLLNAPDAVDQVGALIASAGGGSPDPRLVAIEEKAIDWASRPYVMPILRASMQPTDSGRVVNVAEIASVAGLAHAGAGQVCTDSSREKLTHQVVFVIDTTESMGPYIEGVRRIARTWSDAIRQRGLQDRFRFGVVAYRNNMDQEPQRTGLEYVVQKVLDPAGGNVDAMVTAMEAVKPAKVSTHSFDEDAVAGLQAALDLDWSQGCGVKEIFLVTDAGALAADDPRSRHPGTGLATIAAVAHQKQIRIFPVHLHTPEAKRANNVARAADLYRRELFDGVGANRYVAVANGSPAGFDAYLKGVGVLIDGADAAARGQMATRPAATASPGIRDMVLADLFAVQQRFLGAESGAKAPAFASSWTSDRDLANLDRASLEVSIFLTRSQLSQLAETVERLLANARQSRMESGQFFNLLRIVSAATAQDPARFGGKSATLDAMMPSFLQLLPYKSDVLKLTAEDWRSMGATKQDAFVSRLGQKLKAYRAIYEDQSQWRALGRAESGDEVALIPLSQMP